MTRFRAGFTPARRTGPGWWVTPAGQLRAPWRLGVFMLAFFTAWALASGLLYPVINLVSGLTGMSLVVYPWLMLVAVFAAHVIALRQVDDAPWDAVGLGVEHWRARLLVSGAVLGVAAIGCTLLLLLVTNSVRFSVAAEGVSMGTWAATAMRALLFLAPAALWEELAFRGYLWRIAEDAGGRRIALWSTSVAFGAVHLMNPGAGVQSIGMVILAGVCLGVLRDRTGSVTAPWLAHLGWNWVMAAVVNMPVSGVPFGATGWRLESTGAAWWTGGAWGPEGGAAAALVLTGALLLAARMRPSHDVASSAPREIHAQPGLVAPSTHTRG